MGSTPRSNHHLLARRAFGFVIVRVPSKLDVMNRVIKSVTIVRHYS
jgi:hypothetical protein